MNMKMKIGSKDIPFVYKGDKLVYPNPIKDGLLLWYDFKGMRNTDTNKEVAKDLSGNSNDGQLQNFNFTEESGYKDSSLRFDGVDDYLESTSVPFKHSLTIESTINIKQGKIYAPILRLSPKSNMAIGLIYFGLSNAVTEEETNYRLWAGTRGDSGIVQQSNIGLFKSQTTYTFHLVLDMSQKKIIVYANGKLVSAFEHDIEPIEDLDTVLHIGKQHGQDRIYNADCYSAKIYNRPLTPEEIQHNYQLEKQRFNIEGED